MTAEDCLEIPVKLQCLNGWPPVSNEYLWFKVLGEGLVVKSYPFFVKGLSFGDVLFDTREEKNDVLDVEWKDKSGNSTIWMACRSQDDFDELYDCLREHFNVEGLAEFNLLSVCLMEWQALKELDEAVEGLGNSISFDIAYPSLRHEEV